MISFRIALRPTFLSGLIGLLLNACAQEPESSEIHSIYGQDQRLDVFEEADARLRNAARSVVAMIKTESLQGDRLPSETLGQKFRMCDSERFRNQITASGCSGFLLTPTIVATSGHCFKDSKDCESIAMLFDYAYTQSNSDPSRINRSQLYRCQKILDRAYGGADKKDYALIQLDRSVTDREPLRLQSSKRVSESAELVGIGTPAGLPLKISRGARVLKNQNEHDFEATVDAFGGQSGGPVLNQATGLVEGIIVRGRSDFNIDGPCTTSNTYPDTPDSAEDVTRASVLAAALAQKVPTPAPTPTPNPGVPPSPSQPWPPFPNQPPPWPGFPQPPFPNPGTPPSSQSWASLIALLESIAQDAQIIQYSSPPELSQEAARMQFLASQAALEAARSSQGWGPSASGFAQAQVILLGSVQGLLQSAAQRYPLAEPSWSAYQRIEANLYRLRSEFTR